MDHCFPAQFDLFIDAVYFIGQYRGKPNSLFTRSIHRAYRPLWLHAIRGKTVETGLRKEMSGKNGAVIT